MTGVPVKLPLQIVCQLLVTGQVLQNITTPFSTKMTDTTVGTPSQAKIPDGYFVIPELGAAYKYFAQEMNWHGARKRCNQDGARLPIVESTEKTEIIGSLRLNVPRFIPLGMGRFYGGPDEWTTIDGEPLNNIPWGNKEPIDFGNCLIHDTATNKVGCYPCFHPLPFVCEFPYLP